LSLNPTCHKIDKLVKSKDMLGFVPQPNLQVSVINHHPNCSMGRLIANPIFYERIKNQRLSIQRAKYQQINRSTDQQINRSTNQ
jgi:hypothetical protein